MALYLNKFDFPLSKDNLYQVWLDLVSWFWRKFLKIFGVFLLFCYYLSLEKGSVNWRKTWHVPINPSKWCFVDIQREIVHHIDGHILGRVGHSMYLG
jgi:hypothetical protein